MSGKRSHAALLEDESSTITIQLTDGVAIHGVDLQLLSLLSSCARGLPADAVCWDLSQLLVSLSCCFVLKTCYLATPSVITTWHRKVSTELLTFVSALLLLYRLRASLYSAPQSLHTSTALTSMPTANLSGRHDSRRSQQHRNPKRAGSNRTSSRPQHHQQQQAAHCSRPQHRQLQVSAPLLL
jgi:hypothetical protein